MFQWLKRRASAPVPKPSSAPSAPVPSRRARPTAAPPPFAASVPLPEVVGEGNTQADWSQWEDSMTALDSQLQGLVPSARVYVRDTMPSQLDDVDPFAGVRSKRPSK